MHPKINLQHIPLLQNNIHPTRIRRPVRRNMIHTQPRRKPHAGLQPIPALKPLMAA